MFLRLSAARFRASWLSRSEGFEAQDFAASTILAVASANSLAAVRRRLCYDIVEKRERKFVNTKISREIKALFLFFIIDMIFVI